MQKKERVILIQGDDTQWYEQAIFIVNPKTNNIPTDFVAEAEKIISNYKNGNSFNIDTDIGIAYAAVDTTKLSPTTKWSNFLNGRFFDFFLNIIMAIGCVIITFVLMLGLLN